MSTGPGKMMAQAEVSPEARHGLLDRLETFVHPFCAPLGGAEQRRAAEFLTGLLSHLEHKAAEGIAYLLDPDRAKGEAALPTTRRGTGRGGIGIEPRRRWPRGP